MSNVILFNAPITTFAKNIQVLKSVSATFFVFLYILAMLRPVLPLFDYVINQDYIAEFLCINTDKPELSCNGKCYLMQKLNEQNEEKRQNIPRIAIEEYPIGFVNLILFDTLKESTSFSTDSFLYQNNYFFQYNYSSFHPPSI